MTTNRYEGVFAPILEHAGITVNGNRPCDLQVYDRRLWKKVFWRGSLGLGEAYMDGWWAVEKMDEFFYKVLRLRLDRCVNKTFLKWFQDVRSMVFNMQNRVRGRAVIDAHYNVGNDLYMSFLDPYNQYTCGYFDATDDLNTAQEKKLELICVKLDLQPEDKVLDIGCGWGGFAKFAAERYGCHVTGISISEEQISYAREYTKGLPITIEFMDYRDVQGAYDKILICGMIEHVGYKNYRRIFEIVHRNLNDSGRFLLHTIASIDSIKTTDPWIAKYIFPNSMAPSIQQIGRANEGLFVMEDWQNFGPYYYNTLLAWHTRLMEHWNNLASKFNYDERFRRMWEYFFLSCAGAFRARSTENQLWHILFTKEGMHDVFSMRYKKTLRGCPSSPGLLPPLPQ